MVNEKKFLQIIERLLSASSERIQEKNNIKKSIDVETPESVHFMDKLKEKFPNSFTAASSNICSDLIRLIECFSEIPAEEKNCDEYKEKKGIVLLILNKIKIKKWNKNEGNKNIANLKPDGVFRWDHFICFFEFKLDKIRDKEQTDYWKTVFYIFIGWIHKHISMFLFPEEKHYDFNALSLNYIWPNNVTKNRVESTSFQYNNELSKVDSYIENDWEKYNCFFPKIDFGDFIYENVEGIFQKIINIFEKELIMSEEDMQKNNAVDRKYNDKVTNTPEYDDCPHNKRIEELQEKINDDDLTLNQKNTNSFTM